MRNGSEPEKEGYFFGLDVKHLRYVRPNLLGLVLEMCFVEDATHQTKQMKQTFSRLRMHACVQTVQ